MKAKQSQRSCCLPSMLVGVAVATKNPTSRVAKVAQQFEPTKARLTPQRYNMASAGR